MADKITGAGIAQLAQVANLARTFLAGPDSFAQKAIVKKAANLGALTDITAPISTLATIGKTFSIGALAPLGPIAAGIGILGSVFGFGKKKEQGPVIAHLPPHTIINLIHQKEAIHLFLKPSNEMWGGEGGLGFMQGYANGAAAQGGPNCIAQQSFDPFSGPGPVDRPGGLLNPLNLPRSRVNNGVITSTSPFIGPTGQAWAPGADAGMKKMITALHGATVKGLIPGSNRGFGTQQGRVDQRNASQCVLDTFGGNAGQFNVSTGGGDAVMQFFSPAKFFEKMMENPICQNEQFVYFGAPYLCAWQESFRIYNPSSVWHWRTEIGDWMQTVAAHPLYKDLIQRMVTIELARKQARASNARGAVALIRNPTVKNIREFVWKPIGPALVPASQIAPTTVQALGLKQELLTARADAKEAENTVKAAVLSVTKDENLQGMLQGLLKEVEAASLKAFSTTTASEATMAAQEAKTIAAKAESFVTPGIKKALDFITGTNLLIPALVAAGIYILATSGEGD
jgi:hypothetical protein